VRLEFKVGELVDIDPGYNAGIWLRSEPAANITSNNSHVKSGPLIVLEIGETLFAKDPSVKVISCCGLVGWTFASRLRQVF
jgi:hypothetical protein